MGSFLFFIGFSSCEISLRTCIHSRRCRLGKGFFRQTRQIFAGIRCVLQENLTQDGGKRPVQTAFEVVNTGSNNPYEKSNLKTLLYHITSIIPLQSDSSSILSEIFCPIGSVGLGRLLPKPTFLSEIILCFSLCFQCVPYPVSDKNKFLITAIHYLEFPIAYNLSGVPDYRVSALPQIKSWGLSLALREVPGFWSSHPIACSTRYL